MARASELVGDRSPSAHEFLVQLRSFDASRSGAFLGLPALLALCSALLGKSLRGGLVAVGGLNLGGAIDPVYDPVRVAELAVEKGRQCPLGANRGPEAVERPLRRDGYEAHDPLLLRRPRGTIEGAVRLIAGRCRAPGRRGPVGLQVAWA